jgi:hypothetical protein
MRGLGSLADLQEWAWLFVERHQRNDRRGCCLLTGLAGRLAAAGNDARADVGAEFGRWVTMLSESLRRMRDNGELRSGARRPRPLERHPPSCPAVGGDAACVLWVSYPIIH